MQGALSKRRPTIGVLAHPCKTFDETSLYHGLYDAALKCNVNLLFFTGGSWGTMGYPIQTMLFPLASTERIDGWVVTPNFFTGGISERLFMEIDTFFHEQPIVGIDLSMVGITQVNTDDYCGMRDLLIHLIREHGYHRIGLVRAFEDDLRTLDCYRAYKDVLREFGLEQEYYPVFYKDRDYLGGIRAVEILEAEGALKQLQAIAVCRGKAMEGIFDALMKRGYRIPQDIAIVGFDDDGSSFYELPITRVQDDLYQKGYKALKCIWSRMNGYHIPSVLSVPPQCIIGESCGCTPEQWQVRNIVKRDRYGEVQLNMELVEAVADTLNMSDEKGRSYESINRLLLTLNNDLYAKDGEETFLPLLEYQLNLERKQNVLLRPWITTIAILHQWYTENISDARQLRRLGKLLQKAQLIVGRQIQIQQSSKQRVLENALINLRNFFSRIHACGDLEQLIEFIHIELPRFGIEDCFIALLDAPYRLKDGMDLSLLHDGRLSLAVQTEKSMPLGESPVFSIRSLTPKVSFPKQRYARVVQPLMSEGEYFGYMISGFGHGPCIIKDLFREELVRIICSTIRMERLAKQGRHENGWTRVAQSVM